MKSLSFAGILLLLAAPFAASAAEQKGIVRKVDAATERMTVEVDGKNRTFAVARDASIVNHEPGDKKKAAKIRVIELGLAGVATGSSIEFLTEELDGQVLITSLKVVAAPKAGAAAPKPAPKKKPAQAAKKGAPKNKNKGADKKVAKK